MPTRLYLRIAEFVIAATLALTLFAAYRAERRDRTQLAADLAAAKQTLAQTNARQHDRDAQLTKTLAALAAGKRNVKTPAEIVRALPNEIPLPVTIALDPNFAKNDSNVRCSSGLPWSGKGPNCGPEGLEPTRLRNDHTSTVATQTQAVLPTADLKPLYDFAVDCKACQSKLAAAQADLTDERAKAAILTRERNEAVRVAKGGSLLQRITRNAKWLAIGAIAGAIAAKARR
jgi:hypothetical protein